MTSKNELTITPEIVTAALSKLSSDDGLKITEYAHILAAKIDGITIEDALILLAEIGAYPKSKRIKEI